MTTEQKSLSGSPRFNKQVYRELALRYQAERDAAIEAHEADKKAFSDAVMAWLGGWQTSTARRNEFRERFADFILPEPDPLVEARRQIADRVLRQFGAPASDEDCIGLIVAALEEQDKIERIDNEHRV